MGKTASLIVTVLALLLALTAVAQAQPSCQYVVLECKTNKKGNFLVVAFDDNSGGVTAQINVGDACTEALDSIDNELSPNYNIVNRWINTGSQDRTVYTAISSNCD